MYLVIKKFIDKDRDKEYSIDSIYRSNDEKRIQELKELGYLGEELIIKAISEEEVPKEIKEDPIEDPIEEPEKKSNKKK